MEPCAPRNLAVSCGAFHTISVELSILQLVSVCRLLCIRRADMAREGGDPPSDRMLLKATDSEL